jgi:acid phosphatase
MIGNIRTLRALTAPAVLLATLGTTGCNGSSQTTTEALQSDIQNIVVIYAENRSFDSLFGHFPGANGLSAVLDANGKPTSAYIPQVDRDGTTLSTLPPVWGGVTAGGITPAVTQAQSTGLANQPFSVETAFQGSANATLDLSTVTRDMYHRFFENQMQIDGGKNDQFVAWADSGAMVMGQFDSSSSALYKLAQQYTLADNFFQGAFGGSFLNHQYLICACAPEYPNADTAAAAPSIAVLDKDSQRQLHPQPERGRHQPRLGHGRQARLRDERQHHAGQLLRRQQVLRRQHHAAALPAQRQRAGGHQRQRCALRQRRQEHHAAGPDGHPHRRPAERQGRELEVVCGFLERRHQRRHPGPASTRSVIYAGNSYGVATTANVDFQPHHQPFNYYAEFDPVTHATDRANHLQDYTNLVADAAAGTLPAVSFYKPEGLYNQHPGYANVTDADQKIADLVAKLQASPQWKHMMIVITYDENGGQWDHVAPPAPTSWARAPASRPSSSRPTPRRARWTTPSTTPPRCCA